MRNGRLHRRFTGVYAVGYDVLSLEACFLAAVKACGPDAVLSHYSAAVLHRLLEWDGRAPEVTTLTVRKHPGLVTHRAKTLERCYVNGIPVTPVLRTIIDLAGSRLPDAKLRRAVNEALNQRAIRLGDLSPATIAAPTGCARSSPPPRRPRTSSRTSSSPWPPPVCRSPSRTGFSRTARAARDRGGRRQADVLARADDATRQAVFEAHGETVLRVTWQQATLRPKETLRRIRKALDTRRVMAD